MITPDLITEAGLTEGEAKVYIALLELGSTSTGPLIEKSGVANSIIYRLLDNLIEKGLASYVLHGRLRKYQPAPPQKLIQYIDERKKQLEEKKDKIEQLLPGLLELAKGGPEHSVQMFEGWKGFQTAWELIYTHLKKGEEYVGYGTPASQEEKYHLYWQRDHLRRAKAGIGARLLFNQDAPRDVLKNRNSYDGCEARYMPINVSTKSWLCVFKDITNISIQEVPMAVIIKNQDVADSFRAYFDEMWEKSKLFK